MVSFCANGLKPHSIVSFFQIYKEDDSASEESNPINWKPEILKRRRY